MPRLELGKDHPLAGHVCPWCDHHLDMAANVEAGIDAAPDPGDISVCIRCASPCEFTAAGTLIRCDPRKLDPELRATVEAAMRAVRSIPRNKETIRKARASERK